MEWRGDEIDCQECGQELNRLEDEGGVIWQCTALDCLSSFTSDELPAKDKT